MYGQNKIFPGDFIIRIVCFDYITISACNITNCFVIVTMRIGWKLIFNSTEGIVPGARARRLDPISPLDPPLAHIRV